MKLKTKFQDEDFDLGEVVDATVFCGGSNELKVGARAAKGGYHTFYLGSLKELTDTFEDYEEPKEYWYIEADGTVDSYESHLFPSEEQHKQIGNYFSSREEAEKAVEKLKALTEAKEDGLKIKGYYYNHEDLVILADIGKCNKLTLDTLFGKEID